MVYYQIPKKSNIIVTKHAEERFLQRFRLHFSDIIPDNYFNPSKSIWEDVIKYQITNGHVCYKWEMVPFYVNKIRGVYGNTVVIKRKPCYYLCTKVDNNRLVVKTVVAKWFND